MGANDQKSERDAWEANRPRHTLGPTSHNTPDSAMSINPTKSIHHRGGPAPVVASDEAVVPPAAVVAPVPPVAPVAPPPVLAAVVPVVPAAVVEVVLATVVDVVFATVVVVAAAVVVVTAVAWNESVNIAESPA